MSNVFIGEMKIKVGDYIKTNKDIIAKVIDFKQESISGNSLIIIDQKHVGDFDEKHGYDREYYEKNKYWIYPSEVKGVLNENN